MILNCLKTKEPYIGPKSDCQISPIFLQFWWVLSYIFRLLSPIFLYFWTAKVLDTLHVYLVFTCFSTGYQISNDVKAAMFVYHANPDPLLIT